MTAPAKPVPPTPEEASPLTHFDAAGQAQGLGRGESARSMDDGLDQRAGQRADEARLAVRSEDAPRARRLLEDAGV